MEEIVSLVVANGLWAVLFCGLLVYQLRDSRSRERKYTLTISALSDRLGIVSEVKADTTKLKRDVTALAGDVKELKSDVKAASKARSGTGRKRPIGGAECAIDPA